MTFFSLHRQAPNEQKKLSLKIYSYLEGQLIVTLLII
jgi:hypothetical protein